MSPHLRMLSVSVIRESCPRYVGPYKILAKVGEVAYKLELAPSLAQIHNVFHISSLRKYVADPTHILKPEPLQIADNLTYKEEPVPILDEKNQTLRNRKVIFLLKVLWCSHAIEEATWELESDMSQKYPHLFNNAFELSVRKI